MAFLGLGLLVVAPAADCLPIDPFPPSDTDCSVLANCVLDMRSWGGTSAAAFEEEW